MGLVIPMRPQEGSSTEEPSDAQLVEAARNGTRSALDALYRRHASMALGLAHRLVGRDDEVDDVVQDAFLTAFRSLDRLSDPQSFAKWLGTITVRTAWARIRRKRVARKIGLLHDSPLDAESMVSPSAPPRIGAELKELYAMLEQLSPAVRIALVLRRVEGMTLPEIADHMNLSLATVKRRLKTGEEQLAARLGEAL